METILEYQDILATAQEGLDAAGPGVDPIIVAVLEERVANNQAFLRTLGDATLEKIKENFKKDAPSEILQEIEDVNEWGESALTFPWVVLYLLPFLIGWFLLCYLPASFRKVTGMFATTAAGIAFVNIRSKSDVLCDTEIFKVQGMIFAFLMGMWTVLRDSQIKEDASTLIKHIKALTMLKDNWAFAMEHQLNGPFQSEERVARLLNDLRGDYTNEWRLRN